MLINDSDYLEILNNIKNEIQNSRYKAILSVNRELIFLYWNIGKIIAENSRWGDRFVDNLAKDIRIAFPEMKGFSIRNLRYMKKFATEFSDIAFVQTVSAQISWSHSIVLIEKLQDSEQRRWYAEKTIENGWSVRVLDHQIATSLYLRDCKVKKIQNFQNSLASPQSELAIQTMKDPYVFDFVEFRVDMKEADIEKQLVKNITNLLLELGAGFAFLGNQYPIEVAGEDYRLDLLFYNLNLKCYVIIELKIGKFKPEYAGKMNFYLSAIDDTLKKETDNPSIGLILCRDKNNVTAEYALKDMSKPIGVSEYKFVQELPKELENTLPNIEDIRQHIMKDE